MNLYHYVKQGGIIMYILVFINIIGIAIMINKFILLYKKQKSISLIADELKKNLKNKINNNDITASIELAKQEVKSYVSKSEWGLNTIKVIASIAPLLGLLGTVLGVLLAFEVMSKTGLANPSNFAKGISMALVTTIGGLIVAIPNFIGHHYLISMIDKIESETEKQLISKIL